MNSHPKRHPSDWICEGCSDPQNEYYAKGLCRACYMRQRRRAKGAKPAVNWKSSKCILCGDSKVKAREMCDRCYRRSLPSYVSDERKRQKYLANQRKHFGGRREELLARASNRCEMCGMTDEESLTRWGKKLEIHHVDGRGRESNSPNHDDQNLRVLCRTCHHKMHFGKKERGIAS